MKLYLSRQPLASVPTEPDLDQHRDGMDVYTSSQVKNYAYTVNSSPWYGLHYQLSAGKLGFWPLVYLDGTTHEPLYFGYTDKILAEVCVFQSYVHLLNDIVLDLDSISGFGANAEHVLVVFWKNGGVAQFSHSSNPAFLTINRRILTEALCTLPKD